MIHVLNLLCGISLFLFGMNIMSEGTLKAFGDKLKNMLAVMTKTKTKAILTGTAVTAAVQSSSVVTVTAVNFVETGLLTLYQATGIILGANIGTTVTSLLIAFNLSDFTPVIIFLGTMLVLVSKNKKVHHCGEMLFGFGLLFLGLNTMSTAFAHLKENPDFLNFVVSSSQGKFKGIAAGTVMTAIIQSSSASVGILQSLCLQGLIDTESAIYIVLGQNIGTVFTALLSVIGKSRSTKQAGMIHLIFNVLGSLIFVFLCEIIPVTELLMSIGNPSMRVSVFHIVLNVVTVFMLVPFYDFMIYLSDKLVITKIIRTKKIRPVVPGR